MPRRLLREPHVLAHELRTPLCILAGWNSLIRSGDVHPDRTPEFWASAMAACEAAEERLNALISEACGEAEALQRLETQGFSNLLEMTSAAIEHARRIRDQTDRIRRGGTQRRRTSQAASTA